MRPRTRWLAGLTLVALIAGGLWAARLRPVAVPVAQLHEAPLTRTLQFSARVATRSRVNVGATLTGRVASVAVREGDAVRAGDALVQLEADEARTAVAQAEAGVAQAQARLRGLRGSGREAAQAQAAQASATLRAAEREQVRTEELVAQGFISAARLDEVRRAAEVARAQRQGAQAQLDALADTGADLAQAGAQLAQAQAALQAARARLALMAVHAPADGRVLVRSVEPGQIVQPGSALLGLALAGPTELVAPVDERFLEQLEVGQAARAVADAFPERAFAARVRSIAPAVDAARGAVEVKLVPEPEAPEFLREDMTLSVEVRTGARERALVLPLAALRGDAGGGRATVWRVRDGRVQPVAVRLGLRTLDAAEVLDGLAAGDRVLLSARATPGQRVRPQVQPGPLGAARSDRTGDPTAAIGNALGR